MPVIHTADAAQEILDCCLRGEPWPESVLNELLLDALASDPGTARGGSRALFGILVERLGDLFEPRLAGCYGEVFSRVIERVIPGMQADQLRERYQRIRQPRRFEGDPGRIRNVFVLSRVTLGADVAVTSVILDAAKRAFPAAAIHFVGQRKGWELFSADPRIRHLEAPYTRTGTLRDRLAGWKPLREKIDQPASVVIDPDSRLTQLGLLPVCADENYYFFDSRSFGGESDLSLSELAARWVEQTLGVEGARSFIAPAAEPLPCEVAISLGVGENQAKRLADPFESHLLQGIAREGWTILIDKGMGGEESERVERAVASCDALEGQIRMFRGPFAPFAASIARSALYVGYDSSAQHVAAACGVPLVTIFNGAVSPRFFSRWRPSGSGSMEIVRADDAAPDAVLARALEAVRRLGPVRPKPGTG